MKKLQSSGDDEIEEKTSVTAFYSVRKRWKRLFFVFKFSLLLENIFIHHFSKIETNAFLTSFSIFTENENRKRTNQASS